VEALRDALSRCCQGRTLTMGLGNPFFGDDGFGLALALQLVGAGVPNVVEAGMLPERCLRMAEGMDAVIFLDAVDAGSAPGSVMLLNSAEMGTRCRQMSTHRLSLGLLAMALEADGRTHAWLIGVQPECVAPGAGLSEPVKRAVDAVAAVMAPLLLRSAIGHGKRARAGAAP